MVDYSIGTIEGFRYHPFCDAIRFNIPKERCGHLSEDELQQYIVESIEHEHIHRALFNMFDYTTSSLFDLIEYKFRDEKLHRKVIKYTKQQTYQQLKEKYGIHQLFIQLGVTKDKIAEAKFLCDRRMDI